MSQPQREAILQLMIWTMLVDKSIKVSEQDRIHAFIEQIEWTSAFQIREFFGLSVARIRDAIGDPEKEEALRIRLKDILKDADIQQRALAACVDLARADGNLSVEEQVFLTTLASRFRDRGGREGEES